MKSRGLRFLLFLLAFLAFLYLIRERIFFALGQVLIHAEAPVHADAVIVLGGDWDGYRALKGAQLVRDGYAPFAMFSGVSAMYGVHEATLGINYAISRGYSGENLVPNYFRATSTEDEAVSDIAELRKRGVHSYLLVTSYSHTARATRVFRRLAPDLEEHTVAAPQRHWNNGKWWLEREGRKTWLYEAMKTVSYYLGL